MATLTVGTISRTGLSYAPTAAAGGGDAFANTGKEFFHLVNGGGGAVVVTFVTQVTTGGLAVTDLTVSVPAGEERLIGPFPTEHYNDANNLVQVTYDGVTSVTVAASKLTAAN